jgi:hypothetical protein
MHACMHARILALTNNKNKKNIIVYWEEEEEEEEEEERWGWEGDFGMSYGW